MKKFINNPEDVISENLLGISIAHSDLVKINIDPAFVYRIDAPIKGKVTLVSGGGSGHEPLHTGYVGWGMLDAACPGQIFTSPTPDQIFEAIKTVDGESGVLNIVKNYSGDVMNFEMATEMASADGIQIASMVIDDDTAVHDSLFTQGRRGVGTTVLAEKICGAAAEKGYDFKAVVDLCRKINARGRSMGVALSSCTVPARGEPTFELAENEIEVGIGIHGEPGRYRKNIMSADEITEMTALSIIEDQTYTRSLREWDNTSNDWKEIEITSPSFKTGDRILVMVNNMGGTPLSELYIVYRKLAEICQKKNLVIVRSLVGTYITSLEMQGLSITILNMDDEMTRLWDEPVNTPSLRWGI